MPRVECSENTDPAGPGFRQAGWAGFKPYAEHWPRQVFLFTNSWSGLIPLSMCSNFSLLHISAVKQGQMLET